MLTATDRKPQKKSLKRSYYHVDIQAMWWYTIAHASRTQVNARGRAGRKSPQRIAPQRICVNETFRGTTHFVSILRCQLLVMCVPVNGWLTCQTVGSVETGRTVASAGGTRAGITVVFTWTRCYSQSKPAHFNFTSLPTIVPFLHLNAAVS